jgi:hypothetical protein
LIYPQMIAKARFVFIQALNRWLLIPQGLRLRLLHQFTNNKQIPCLFQCVFFLSRYIRYKVNTW